MVYTTTLEAKRLEILHKLLPRAELIGVLVDPTFPPVKEQVEELQLPQRLSTFKSVFSTPVQSQSLTQYLQT